MKIAERGKSIRAFVGISHFRPVVASYGVGPLGCDPLTVNPAIRAGKNPNPLGLGVRQISLTASACMKIFPFNLIP